MIEYTRNNEKNFIRVRLALDFCKKSFEMQTSVADIFLKHESYINIVRGTKS